MYSLRLVVPPTEEPVTLEAAKVHLRVEHDADDALISAQITAAREWAEGFTGLKVLEQTWDVLLQSCPPSFYRIPVGPVRSVVSITYRTGDDIVATVPTDAYYLAGEDLHLVPGASWPGAAVSIVIRVMVGVATVDEVPRAIRQAILLVVGHWYANREAINIGNIVTPIPLAAESLLWLIRRVPT